MNWMKTTTALLVALALAGCAAGPNVRGKAVPTAFFVFYEKDSVTPTGNPEEVFDQAAAYLTQYDNTFVRIVGHVSADETVKMLDQLRASHVAEELAKRGAQAPRMELLGVGTAESVSEQGEGVDASSDRRVELMFSAM